MIRLVVVMQLEFRKTGQNALQSIYIRPMKDARDARIAAASKWSSFRHGQRKDVKVLRSTEDYELKDAGCVLAGVNSYADLSTIMSYEQKS